MCAPIAGQSEFVFFIIHPNKVPSRKTFTRSFITGAETPFFEIQYGMCTPANNSADITFAIQKLKLSFNRFKKNPLNKISSDIGETDTPTRMLSQSADRSDSIAPVLFPDINDSPMTTAESQTVTTIMHRSSPRLLTAVLSFM
jgi:hypothetical protein